ncbi:MAG: NADH-quinone oxidoreductase subunit J family protein, partial [Gammaproteobacteria bacterium]
MRIAEIISQTLREGFTKYLPLGGLVALLMMVAMSWVVGSRYFKREVSPHPADYSNTRELGKVLYTDYIYPFEIAAIILLVAIVAAIALTMRERRQLLKTQKPELQVAVQRQDRIRLVKRAAE